MIRFLLAAFLAGLVLTSGGCDKIREVTSPDADDENNAHFQKAKEKYGMMDYQGAIEAYEKGLRQNPRLAKAHLELALIYDDKFKDHISAIYHFRKYVEMRPDSGKKEMVQEFIDNSMQQLMSQDSAILSNEKAEIIRLRTENNSLRAQLGLMRQESFRKDSSTASPPKSSPPPAPASQPPPPTPSAPASAAQVETPPVPPASGRYYTVQPGDTLASISRKFFNNSSGQWKKILDANPLLQDEPKNLKPGQRLVIPE